MSQRHTRATDAELLRLARSDAGAFRELYDRYAARIQAFHQRQCRDIHVAHDLTAETFAQAWEHRARFKDLAGGSAAPWLFGIARNVLLRSVRARLLERSACERLGLIEALDREPSAPEPTEEWLDGIDDALDELPPDQRDAIRMRVVDGVSYEDAATQLSATPQVVRARVSRGLRTLRGRMTNKGEAL